MGAIIRKKERNVPVVKYKTRAIAITLISKKPGEIKPADIYHSNILRMDQAKKELFNLIHIAKHKDIEKMRCTKYKHKINARDKCQSNARDKYKSNTRDKHESNAEDECKSNTRDKYESNARDKNKSNDRDEHQSNARDKHKSNARDKQQSNTGDECQSNTDE